MAEIRLAVLNSTLEAAVSQTSSLKYFLTLWAADAPVVELPMPSPEPMCAIIWKFLLKRRSPGWKKKLKFLLQSLAKNVTDTAPKMEKKLLFVLIVREAAKSICKKVSSWWSRLVRIAKEPDIWSRILVRIAKVMDLSAKKKLSKLKFRPELKTKPE